MAKCVICGKGAPYKWTSEIYRVELNNQPLCLNCYDKMSSEQLQMAGKATTLVHTCLDCGEKWEGSHDCKKPNAAMVRALEEKNAKLLVTEDMSEAEIRKRIYQDMSNLAMHEAGTGWMRLGTLLSGNSTDQILGSGLKAIIDQNKIIIRQNELLLRALKQAHSPPPPP